jgi:putative tryptophan/tyrosine transport system substrate-binding protein
MQNSVPSRVGFLSPVPRGHLFEAFQQELAALGHRDSHELVIESRSAEGQYARFPALVAELVDLRMDVIAVVGAVTVRAVKHVTSTIPTCSRSWSIRSRTRWWRVWKNPGATPP